MEKVLIFYAAYGGGHLSAARSLKEHIDLNYPQIDCELIDCMKYINKTIEAVTTKAYSEMAKKTPFLWGRIYSHSESGPVAHISNASNKIMSFKLQKLLNEKKPSLIINTHPFGSQMCAFLKKHHKLDSKIATVMTDHASHNQWLVGHEYIDYFFVSHEDMKNDLCKKGIPSNKIFATGIPLSHKFLLNYDKSEILNSFGLSCNKKTILFFGGGELGLGKSTTSEIFKSFLNNTNIQIVVISGKNQKLKNSFETAIADSNGDTYVKILEYTDKVPELMYISDLVVTKPGGLTTTESLASGLPIIIINPIPGQEYDNAEYLQKNKVAIWIKKNDDVKLILNELFSSPDKIQEMKVNARLLSKKNSTTNICNILFNQDLSRK